MKKIIRACFSRNQVVLVNVPGIIFLYSRRKVCAVPVETFIKIDIKKVRLFDIDGCNAGVFYQVSIEGGGSSFLRSDDNKVWHHPYRVGTCSKHLLKNILIDRSHVFY